MKIQASKVLLVDPLAIFWSRFTAARLPDFEVVGIVTWDNEEPTTTQSLVLVGRARFETRRVACKPQTPVDRVAQVLVLLEKDNEVNRFGEVSTRFWPVKLAQEVWWDPDVVTLWVHLYRKASPLQDVLADVSTIVQVNERAPLGHLDTLPSAVMVLLEPTVVTDLGVDQLEPRPPGLAGLKPKPLCKVSTTLFGLLDLVVRVGTYVRVQPQPKSVVQQVLRGRDSL